MSGLISNNNNTEGGDNMDASAYQILYSTLSRIDLSAWVHTVVSVLETKTILVFKIFSSKNKTKQQTTTKEKLISKQLS